MINYIIIFLISLSLTVYSWIKLNEDSFWSKYWVFFSFNITTISLILTPLLVLSLNYIGIK